jgi:hypothetical protein
MSEHLVRSEHGGMVHWVWPEQGIGFWWQDGHPVRRESAGGTVLVMWLSACKHCRPDVQS